MRESRTYGSGRGACHEMHVPTATAPQVHHVGVGLSHERSDSAGAEGFHSLEGNMCGTAMQGADALPGSKATSRAQGSHRNLGGLASGRQELRERDGPHREGEEP